jgi:hypothetical protein
MVQDEALMRIGFDARAAFDRLTRHHAMRLHVLTHLRPQLALPNVGADIGLLKVVVKDRPACEIVQRLRRAASRQAPVAAVQLRKGLFDDLHPEPRGASAARKDGLARRGVAGNAIIHDNLDARALLPHAHAVAAVVRAALLGVEERFHHARVLCEQRERTDKVAVVQRSFQHIGWRDRNHVELSKERRSRNLARAEPCDARILRCQVFAQGTVHGEIGVLKHHTLTLIRELYRSTNSSSF